MRSLEGNANVLHSHDFASGEGLLPGSLARDPALAASGARILVRERRARTRPTVDVSALLDRILQHYTVGEGLAHHHLLPDDHRGTADVYSRTYYDQARLLDFLTRILRAATPSPRYARENPTAGALDLLIGRDVVDDPTLIADVMSANAHLHLIGGDRYVTGLRWPRLSIARTPEKLEPLFQPPAVRAADLLPRTLFVPGIREWIVVYFRRAPSEPDGVVPAYPVPLDAACALLQHLPSDVYSLTSGRRKDWTLDRARLRPRPNTRELLFHPVLFWRWLHAYQRD